MDRGRKREEVKENESKRRTVLPGQRKRVRVTEYSTAWMRDASLLERRMWRGRDRHWTT